MSSELDPELRQLMGDVLRDLKTEGKIDSSIADRMLKDVVQDRQHPFEGKQQRKTANARWWQFWK